MTDKLKEEPKKKSVERKKRVKKKKQEERLAGLILLIITVFIGFVLWVSGEMKTKKAYNNLDKSSSQNEGGVIIIK